MRRCLTLLVVAAALTVGACKEGGAVRVRSLTFVGTKAINTSTLADSLATRPGSKLPWGARTYFDRARFDADLQRVQAFYADRGFPDARVVGADVRFNAAQDAVDLTVSVSEGAPVTIGAIRFDGFDAIPEPRMEAVRSEGPLGVGAVRDRQRVLAVRDRALNELKERGFPYARVDVTEDDGPTGHVATLTFTAAPGAVARVGAIQIQGNQAVGERVISRELTFKPGDVYQRSVLQESQRRLYGMELFQFVNIEPLNADQPVEVPVRITVAEGNHRRLNFGVGYGVDEKGRVDAEYRNLNFLGGARSAGAHVRWSTLDRGVRFTFNQPYVFDPHVSFGGTAQQWYTFTPAYQTIVSGGNLAVTYRPSQRTSWTASVTSERDSSSIASDVLGDVTLRNSLIALGLDPRTGEQTGRLNAVGVDLQRSTTGSLLDARSGYQLSVHVDGGGRLLQGTFSYDAFFADAREYQPLGDRFVLASRIQGGLIRPADGDPANVPFSKKYFLGGATTVRGWGRYEISPLSDSGLPVGGNSMLAFSEELRADLGRSVGGVLFLDGGNVWADAAGMRLSGLRYAAGTGLRYQTPIGPIRVDFGYQLNPIPNLRVNGDPETRHWRLHFSIGQAF